MTKRFNISKPRKYTDKSGNEKTYWDKVGEMVEFEKQDGSVSRIIKIPAIGLEANVFEEKPRKAVNERRESVDASSLVNAQDDGIDFDAVAAAIPF